MMTDPIADFLTRIRNGLMMKHEGVVAPSSNMTRRLAQILKDYGYIEDLAERTKDGRRQLWLGLKYAQDGEAVIEGIKRVSRPGLRVYSGSKDLRAPRGGLGIAIVSTSKGVMTSREARKVGVGGEVLCNVW